MTTGVLLFFLNVFLLNFTIFLLFEKSPFFFENRILIPSRKNKTKMFENRFHSSKYFDIPFYLATITAKLISNSIRFIFLFNHV